MMPMLPSFRLLVVLLLAPFAGIAAADGPATVPGAEPKPPAADSAQPELSADLVYRLLVGDVALQRGDLAIAARAYHEAARDSGNAALARRATEIALAARQRSLALEAARLWARLDPDADRPKQLINALASGNASRALELGTETTATRADLEKALAKVAESPENLAAAFLDLNRLVAHGMDRAAAFRLVTDLARPYPGVAEAHFAVALAGYATGLADRAVLAASRDEVDAALRLKPDWDRAALLKGEILGKESPSAAISWLESFRATHPESKAVAGALAQHYIGAKRYAEARAVFEAMRSADPANRDLAFGLAAIAIQMKDWASAESLLLELKEAGYGENAIVEWYLAQVAEDTGRYQLAFERYQAVPDGERGWIARLRAAAMLGKLNRLPEARKYLAELPAVSIEQRVQVRQADAQLLRDAGDYPAAYAVLERGLDEFPDDTDLLYDLAMVAEKLDKLDVVERNLSRVIALKPDNPHALNSLGYTLVDRTPRVAEGYALIEKAHRLAPDDPFILDSMGWASYRLGRIGEAEDYLRRALAQRPDAEIAAHLGEVLWAKGERDGARAIWRAQLETSPDNPVLLETIRRLEPK